MRRITSQLFIGNWKWELTKFQNSFIIAGHEEIGAISIGVVFSRCGGSSGSLFKGGFTSRLLRKRRSSQHRQSIHDLL